MMIILDFENNNNYYRLMVCGYDAITREYNNIHCIILVVQMGGDGLHYWKVGIRKRCEEYWKACVCMIHFISSKKYW